MQNEYKSMTEEEKMRQAMCSAVTHKIRALKNEQSILVDGESFPLHSHQGSICDGDIYNVHASASSDDDYKFHYSAKVRLWVKYDGLTTTQTLILNCLCKLSWSDKQWKASIDSLTFSKK